MNLKTVTITGVDDKTNLCSLKALSQDYPFVEWGILFSATRTGIEPRYPTLNTMHHINNLDLNLSVHLCGSLARDAVANTGYPFQAAMQFVSNAKRIQINLGKDIDKYADLQNILLPQAVLMGVQCIMQVYSFDSPAVVPGITDRVVYLHDASGGRGIVGEFQKPIDEFLVGFAGGITPYNFSTKIEQIIKLDFQNDFWIDMESGVRTDDYLDLDKVEQILKLAKCYQKEKKWN